MKRKLPLVFVLLLVSCGGVDTGNGTGTQLSAEEAAAIALAATGDAYVASIQDAEALALTFNGETSGVMGRAEWDGTIDVTDNLNGDYEIIFTNYRAVPGGAVLNGDMQVAVSENGTACSGTWMIVDLLFDNDVNDFELDTTGTGITLQGSDCSNMNLSGSVNVSGDATGNNCVVTGTTTNPVVNCL